MLILVADMIEESLTNGLFYISSINAGWCSQLHWEAVANTCAVYVRSTDVC